MATTPTAATPRITPPYGFQEVIALTKTHRVLLPKGPTVPVVFRTMNPIPVSYTEFPLACRDYALVFISADDGKTYAPMLVLGLAAQQNLFVMSDDTWDRRAYLPAYVRRATQLEQVAGRTPLRALPLKSLLEQVERRLIEMALRMAKGKKGRAARILSIWRPLLLRRMEKLGIKDE